MRPTRLVLLCAFVLSRAAAQAQLQLPTLVHLGSATAAAESIEIPASSATDADALVERLAASKAVVLRVDARVPCRTVESLLVAAAAKGLESVPFAAVLPDGREGVFTFALPVADAKPTLFLRLHTERVGVPVSSAVPLLARMRDGIPAADRDRFTIAVVVPNAAPWSVGIEALAAVAAAGVQRATFATVEAESRSASLAIDLEPEPHVQVVAQAVPMAKPVLVDGHAGLLQRATADGVVKGKPPILLGQVGGLQPMVPWEAFPREMVRGALGFVLSRQRPDGLVPDEYGRGDVGATALLVVALRMVRTPDVDARRTGGFWRAIGALHAQQLPDGFFSTDLRDHALATWALTEAAVVEKELLSRGALVAGLQALRQQRGPTAGFACSRGESEDVLTTALAVLALAKADRCRLAGAPGLADPLAHFDLLAQGRKAAAPVDARARPPAAIAAELATRLFLQSGSGASSRTLTENAIAEAMESLLALPVGGDPVLDVWRAAGVSFEGARWTRPWVRMVAAELEQSHEEGRDGLGSWPPGPSMSRERTTLLRVLALVGPGGLVQLPR